jgi:hypothetical protein
MSDSKKKMAFVTIGDNKAIEMREVPATVKAGESFDDFVPDNAGKFEKVTVKVHGFVGNDSPAASEKPTKSRFKPWMKWVAVVLSAVLLTALVMNGCGQKPKAEGEDQIRQYRSK